MEDQVHRIGVARAAGAAAIALTVFFAICWIAAFLPFPGAAHSYIGLFTAASDPKSGSALLEGLGWSVVFGLIGGGLVAVAYNSLGRFSHG